MKFAAEAGKPGSKISRDIVPSAGMRASIYNAMPIEGVEKLVAFMKEFAAANPKK